MEKKSPDTQEENGLTKEYSSYHGFKSFAQNGTLSVEDLVKGISRMLVAEAKEVEEQVESEGPGEDEEVPETYSPSPAQTFAEALIGGDRMAVFAEFRQQTRDSFTPERFLSDVVCLLDDVYRSRSDGSSCDEHLARISARIDTPTLERVIGALATAIDASYSDSVTASKLALTRALSILGA